MKSIRGIFFDAFRTLVYLHPTYPGAFADVARDFGYPVDEARVAAVLDSIERAMEARWRERGDFRCSAEELNRRWRALNRAIFEAIGIDGDADRLSAEMERRFDSGEYIRTYPDTLPVIEQLRQEGFRLGVISNGTPGVARCLEMAGISERVEFVLVSALAGWEKPAAEIFTMGLQAVGLQPNEVVFVGDHYEADIVGARQAGMRAVLIDRESRASADDCVKVCDLLEFRQWLDAQDAGP